MLGLGLGLNRGGVDAGLMALTLLLTGVQTALTIEIEGTITILAI